MKIAVISDIHANLIALKEVLKHIEAENCDKVVCLGDIVLAGPQPKETIDFVRAQDWIVIQGNTDKLIADYGDDVLAMMKKNFPIMANAITDDIKRISQDDISYLRNLPAQMLLDFDNVTTLLVHGSPRANNEDILPNMPLVNVEEIVRGVEADLILCGHTHIPCGYQTHNQKTLVNVGSVGRPMTSNPLACYVTIDFYDGKFAIKHNFVDYDKNTVVKMIKERPFVGVDELAELIVSPKSRHV